MYNILIKLTETSPCHKIKVGAIVTINGRAVSSAVNDSIVGASCKDSYINGDAHREWSKKTRDTCRN